MAFRPRLAIAATLGGIAYLGLAVAGLGGFAVFFSHPALIALAIVVLLESFSAAFTEGNVSPGIRENRDNRWVLSLFSVLGLASGFVPAYTNRIGFWMLDGETTRWAGVALVMLGGVLRLYPVFVLGNRFSGLVAIQPGHALVTTGIYRFIRNPSYLGLLLLSFGWALAFRSGVGLILAALLIPPLIARMHSEEALLHDHFGTEYNAYLARTWRLIPGLY